jgi:putative transposase
MHKLSYRDLEEIMEERDVRVDHVALNRWIVKYSPIVAARAQSKKRPTLSSWRMDETYDRSRLMPRETILLFCRSFQIGSL